MQLTKALGLELARYDIRVNALAPGYFRTEMNQDFFDTEQRQSYILQKVPMRRLGNVEELSGSLLLLANDAGSFMSGTVISINGWHVNNPLGSLTRQTEHHRTHLVPVPAGGCLAFRHPENRSGADV